MNDKEYRLRGISDKVEIVMRRYDPERDLIPNAPQVTYTDSVALSLIADLTEIVKELVAEQKDRE